MLFASSVTFAAGALAAAADVVGLSAPAEPIDAATVKRLRVAKPTATIAKLHDAATSTAPSRPNRGMSTKPAKPAPATAPQVLRL
ncbi:MAG: hypothetical protein MUF70_14375, partial [Myxococcota bacterium]|nr:hypothetical protein [Myxococcota bacterium]